MEASLAMEQFAELAVHPDDAVDLARGAALIGAAIEPDADPVAVLDMLDSVAEGVRGRLAETDLPLTQVNVLNEYLFDQLGFAGNTDDYYDPRNSLLHRVIERRVGIPITLSLLYIEVGARCRVPLVGIGMPGHFLVRHRAEDSLFIDPFYRGVLLSESECAERLGQISGSVRWDRAFLEPVTNRSLLARVLRNLCAIWVQRSEPRKAEQVLSMLIMLQPDEPGHRRDRGMLRHQMGRTDLALEDLDSYLDRWTTAPDGWYVRRLVDQLRREG